ncbi:MAG: hypothetical protein WDO19_19180 [Bacteroidota bacterium]
MSKIIKEEDNVRLIVSSVRALWGCVTPTLRSVSVEFNENKIIWQCIFDENATDEDLELLTDAAGEVISDFPDLDIREIVQTNSFTRQS